MLLQRAAARFVEHFQYERILFGKPEGANEYAWRNGFPHLCCTLVGRLIVYAHDQCLTVIWNKGAAIVGGTEKYACVLVCASTRAHSLRK